MRLKWLITAAALALAATSGTAMAQHRYAGHAYGHAYGYGRFYGRSFRSFSPVELSLWRGGRWIHGWHGGIYSWWWFVDDGWYPYAAPVYPYPVYVPGPEGYGPPPPPYPPEGAQDPSQTWYHCDNPDGYYPYVRSCNGPWRPVPATPGPGSDRPDAGPPPPPRGGQGMGDPGQPPK